MYLFMKTNDDNKIIIMIIIINIAIFKSNENIKNTH